MILDGFQGVLVVGATTAVVVMVAEPVAPPPALFLLGFWTIGVALLALPALVVLHATPPPVPLSQRSALFASAKWFGRTVWAGMVFAVSIVIGTVAGVAASRTSDAEQDFGKALGAVITTTSQIALWPIVAAVAAVAYAVMGIKWILDLGAISDNGGAHQVWATLELRWFGPKSLNANHLRLRQGLAWIAASLVGRVGLILTLLTLGLAAAITWFTLARS